MESIDIIISRVVYHDKSKYGPPGGLPYLIARTASGQTIKGNMRTKPPIGTQYRLWGSMRPQKNGYPDAFEFATYEPLCDRTTGGIASYLSKHLPGIGPVKAKALVDAFGTDTLDVLRSDHRKAMDIPGITEDLCDAIKVHFSDSKTLDPVAMAKLAELFDGYRIPRKVVERCVRQWRSAAPEVIKEHPYRLMSFPRVGWKTADAFATGRIGFPEDGLDRHAAALMEALNRLADDGHTAATRSEILATAERLLGGTLHDQALEQAITDGNVVVATDGDGMVYQLVALADAEATIADCLKRIQTLGPKPLISLSIADEIDLGHWAYESGLAIEQYEAMDRILREPVSILTGGPGTGKSRTISYLVMWLRENGYRSIRCCSPTGKAAKRTLELLGEIGITDVPSTTIHKALEPGPPEGEEGVSGDDAKFGRARDGWSFKRHAANPIDERIIIVDECFPMGTMVDTEHGSCDISEIVPGDSIINALGVDHVIATAKKEVRRVACIQVGGKEILASENHPFFTRRGIVLAHDLEPGDSLLQTIEAMRLLRENDLAEAEPWDDSAFLRSVLLDSLVDAVSGVQGQSPQRGDTSQDGRRSPRLVAVGASGRPEGDREDQGSQSHDPSGSCRQGVSTTQGDRTSAIGSRRQRTWSNEDRSGLDGCPSRLGSDCSPYGDGTEEGIRIPDSLQTRCGQSESEDLHRVGREKSSLSQGSGSTKDRATASSRVDRVEILESGDPRLDRFRDADGKLYFYDLQAARHQSFSVEGFLVHNCSMLDAKLAASLLSAIAPGTRLIFVGDTNQLPSVGPGSVLRDMIAAGIPTATLTEIRRSDICGTVVHACHDIIADRPPRHADAVNLPVDNWVHIELDNPDDIASRIVEIVSSIKTFDRMWGVQVISPQKGKLRFGCDNLNLLLSKALNPDAYAGALLTDAETGEIIDGSNGEPKIGDKVVRTKNETVDEIVELPAESTVRADLTWRGIRWVARPCPVVNGDMGTVVDILDDYVFVEFREPQRLCRLPIDESHIILAYAMTTHKMQGSGSPCVIFPVHDSYYFDTRANKGLWCRELAYTSISRTEQLLITIGRWAAFLTACRRKTTNRRRTTLAARMKGLTVESLEGSGDSEKVRSEPEPDWVF